MTTGSPAPGSISVVVPVHNSARTVESFYQRMSAVLDAVPETSEIVFVDDGSRDGSWALLEQLAAEHREVTAVRLSRNFGQGAAAAAGCRQAVGDAIVVIDADLEMLPEDLPLLLDAYRSGHDLVSGVRPTARDRRRRWPSAIANKVLSRLSGARFEDFGCAYAVVRRSIIEDWLDSGDYRRNLLVMPLLVQLADSWEQVPIGWGGRAPSSYRVSALFLMSIELMCYFGRPFSWAIGGGSVLVGMGVLPVPILVGMVTHAWWVAVAAGFALFVLGCQMCLVGAFAHHTVTTLKYHGTPFVQVRDVVGGER